MPNHFHEDRWQLIQNMPEGRKFEPFLGALQLSNGVWEIHSLKCDDDDGELHHSCAECGWSFDDFTHWMDMPHPPSPSNRPPQ